MYNSLTERPHASQSTLTGCRSIGTRKGRAGRRPHGPVVASRRSFWRPRVNQLLYSVNYLYLKCNLLIDFAPLTLTDEALFDISYIDDIYGVSELCSPTASNRPCKWQLLCRISVPACSSALDVEELASYRLVPIPPSSTDETCITSIRLPSAATA